MTDPAFASIRDLGARIRAREVSPAALVEAILARIERGRPLNAFVTVTADAARAQAAEAEREIAAGRIRGPLHGVPVSLKDVIDTQGIRTTCGSRILADRVPAEDATVAARLRAAGAVLIGKNTLHEFAFGVTSNNPHYGPARNPWDPERIPGGSSGGSGAAVAAGLGPASIGTDTGGSIRIPAALCGVVGLKPTYGRVSRRGVFPLSWSLDHVGPLTRTVEDAALILQAIAGPDPGDASTLGQAVPEFTSGFGGSTRGIRVGVLADDYHQEMTEEVRRAFAGAQEVLRDHGFVLENVALPHAAEAQAAALGILYAEAASVHEGWLRDRGGDYGADTRMLLLRGQFLTAGQYLRAQRARTLIVDEAAAMLRRYTVLVLPTVPLAAPPIGDMSVRFGGRLTDARTALTRFCRLANLTGLPAVTVPCGAGSAGLPLGLQVVGGRMDEATMLAVAHAYEQATRWHLRTPSVEESRAS